MQQGLSACVARVNARVRRKCEDGLEDGHETALGGNVQAGCAVFCRLQGVGAVLEKELKGIRATSAACEINGRCSKVVGLVGIGSVLKQDANHLCSRND